MQIGGDGYTQLNQGGMDIHSGGLTVQAGGIVTDSGLTVTSGGLLVKAGGATVIVRELMRPHCVVCTRVERFVNWFVSGLLCATAGGHGRR